MTTNRSPATSESPTNLLEVDSTDYSLFHPVFADKLRHLIERARRREVHAVVASGLRGPMAQAKLWCGSRDPREVAMQKDVLKAAGAGWIASLLDVGYAGKHPPRTDSLPGQSWHQWGEAADVYCLLAGTVAIWQGTLIQDMVALTREIGGIWFPYPGKRPWHVQGRGERSPMYVTDMTWAAIEKEMLSRFAR